MVYVFHIKICIIKFILQFSIWKWHISWQKLFSQSSWLYFFFYDKILEIRGQKGKQKTLVNHLTPSGRRNIGKQKTLVTNFYLMEKNEIYNKILYTNSSYFWFSFSIINYYIIKISVLCFSNVLENSPGGKKKKLRHRLYCLWSIKMIESTCSQEDFWELLLCVGLHKFSNI